MTEQPDDAAVEPARTKKPGTPNPVWDACEEVLGYEPKTRTEKAIWGKMTFSLKLAGADREKILAVAQWYKRTWPEVDLTITAIEKWYSHFLRMAEKKKKHVCIRPGCGLSFTSIEKLNDHRRNVHDEQD